MARRWTEEEKAEASRVAKQRYADRMTAKEAEARERSGFETSVAVAEDEPEIMRPDGRPVSDDGAARISQSDLFVARMKAQQAVTTVDDLKSIAGEDADLLSADDQRPSTIEHTSGGLVWMYKRETWGWRRLRVARNSVVELIKAGFLDRCGSCGSTRCPGSINGCEKAQKRMYRDCPVAGCNDGSGKRFYDMEDPDQVALPNEDPFAIRDDAYAKSTPESRTKAQLDAHIRGYHETEAMARGLMTITSAPQVA